MPQTLPVGSVGISVGSVWESKLTLLWENTLFKTMKIITIYMDIFQDR